MVNTNADIIFVVILITLSLSGIVTIAAMIRSYYREMRKLEAQEARASRLDEGRRKAREAHHLSEADMPLYRREGRHTAAELRIGETRIPHLPPGEKLVFGDRKTDRYGYVQSHVDKIVNRPTDQMRRRGDVIADIQRDPPANLPVARSAIERQADERFRQQEQRRRQDERFRQQEQRRRQDEARRIQREEEQAAETARRRDSFDPSAGSIFPDFTPSMPSSPSKPDTSIEAGGGSSGGAGASGSWDSPSSSSSDSSSSSSSSSSDSGSSSSSSD